MPLLFIVDKFTNTFMSTNNNLFNNVGCKHKNIASCSNVNRYVCVDCGCLQVLDVLDGTKNHTTTFNKETKTHKCNECERDEDHEIKLISICCSKCRETALPLNKLDSGNLICDNCSNKTCLYCANVPTNDVLCINCKETILTKNHNVE